MCRTEIMRLICYSAISRFTEGRGVIVTNKINGRGSDAIHEKMAERVDNPDLCAQTPAKPIVVDVPTADLIKSARSPELQRRIEEFHQKIGKALCENLNTNVLAESQNDVQSIEPARGNGDVD
jgi:hypothetical protein